MAKTGVRAKKPLVILDFDGTLARVVPNPAQAKISAKTKAELEKIACVAKVVILTGRPRDFVQRQLVGDPAPSIEEVRDWSDQQLLAGARAMLSFPPLRVLTLRLDGELHMSLREDPKRGHRGLRRLSPGVARGP